jgi:dTDP-4-dehydrorhamnose reductase
MQIMVESSSLQAAVMIFSTDYVFAGAKLADGCVDVAGW